MLGFTCAAPLSRRSRRNKKRKRRKKMRRRGKIRKKMTNPCKEMKKMVKINSSSSRIRVFKIAVLKADENGRRKKGRSELKVREVLPSFIKSISRSKLRRNHQISVLRRLLPRAALHNMPQIVQSYFLIFLKTRSICCSTTRRLTRTFFA
jgi:hypothetical protein